MLFFRMLRFCVRVVVVKSLQNRSQIGKKAVEGDSGKQYELKASKRDARASQEQPRSGPRAPRDIEATPDSSLRASQTSSRSVLKRRNGSKRASQRRREEGKHEKRDLQGHHCFPNVKTMFLKVRTSILECQIARHRSNSGKKVAGGYSGKQDELKSEQEGRKSEPRAAEKRPKSTERHLGDA